MAYGDFKDLTRRTASDKILRDKAFNIAKNPKYDGYQKAFASMVYKFLINSPEGVVLITIITIIMMMIITIIIIIMKLSKIYN